MNNFRLENPLLDYSLSQDSISQRTTNDRREIAKAKRI